MCAVQRHHHVGWRVFFVDKGGNSSNKQIKRTKRWLCRREENFFSPSPTLHPFPSVINTPRIPFFQATESFISQKLRLILPSPPYPPNTPTRKWQRLVMIYGPNFILFLFFFFQSDCPCAASLARSSTPPPPPYITCVVQFMLFSCIPEHVYPATVEHQPIALYNNIIIQPRRPLRRCGRATLLRAAVTRRTAAIRAFKDVA